MLLQYIYNSGFAIINEDSVIIIDYYKDVLDNCKTLLNKYLSENSKKLYILSSHVHADHFNREILSCERDDIIYIFSRDIEQHVLESSKNIIFLEKGDVYEDEAIAIKAFGSTDVGISFYIETGGKRIFHGGDLNNWHWNEEVSEDEAKQYENHFLSELEIIADYVQELDVLMFPTDPRLGRDYMLGAEQFISKIKTKQFAPMHFGENYNKAAAFGKYAEAKGCRFIRWEARGDETEV